MRGTDDARRRTGFDQEDRPLGAMREVADAAVRLHDQPLAADAALDQRCVESGQIAATRPASGRH